MSEDTVDISMDDVVAQYRDEVIKHIGEKVLLQAAVKNLSEKQTELIAQIQQLTDDLSSSVGEIGRLTDRLDAAQAAAAPLEEESLPLRPVPIPATATHIPYTLGANSDGE
jgi:hypothetical protein